jgi:hypothetical protein
MVYGIFKAEFGKFSLVCEMTREDYDENVVGLEKTYNSFLEIHGRETLLELCLEDGKNMKGIYEDNEENDDIIVHNFGTVYGLKRLGIEEAVFEFIDGDYKTY